MISDGSCDAEDWSNEAENVALITEIKYIFKYKAVILYSKLYIVSTFKIEKYAVHICFFVFF